jgi:hypothetical protein
MGTQSDRLGVDPQLVGDQWSLVGHRLMGDSGQLSATS